jgi:hypothetical protein
VTLKVPDTVKSSDTRIAMSPAMVTIIGSPVKFPVWLSTLVVTRVSFTYPEQAFKDPQEMAREILSVLPQVVAVLPADEVRSHLSQLGPFLV